MSKRKEKIYASSLIASDILLGTPDGPVRIYIDENKRLSIDLDDKSGQTKSVRIDPINNKIDVDNVGFRDGSSFTLSNGKIPEDKIPEIIESKLSSDIRTKLNSTSTAISSYFDENNKLKDANAPSDYSSVRDNASNGNTAFNKFSAAGGKLPIDLVNPPGSYTGWADINTDLARGISASSSLDELDFSIDNTDTNNPIIKINKGAGRFATTTIGKSSIGLENVANQSPDTIRSGITIDNSGAIKGIGTGVDTIIGNNKITVDGTTGKLQGIGTDDVVVSNDKISITTDSTTGVITFNKGIGQPITSNPFDSTKFTEVSGVANTAKSTADAASSTATTVRGFFTNTEVPQLNLTYLPLLNESKLASTITTKLGYANTLNGYFTGGKLQKVNAPEDYTEVSQSAQSGSDAKNEIGTFNFSVNLDTGAVFLSSSRGQIGNSITKSSFKLDQVANESPNTIRSGITIDANGALQGIGSGAGTTINNSKITINSTTGVIEGIGTSNIPVDLRKSATTSFVTSSNIVLVGNTAKKITNISSWNDQVYSKDGFVSGAYCSAILPTGTAMFGLNTDPLTDANYTSLDYAWYRAGATTAYIFESGVNRGSFASSLEDVLSITYDGKDIKYFVNGDLKRTVTVSITNKLFFDSSFYSNNATLTNIQFGPLSSIGETYNLANTANTLSNTIESRFTSGKLNEANASDALKNANVFTDTKFTDVSGAANTASLTATTVRGYFDTNGILDINNAPSEVKNSNISLNLINSSLSLTGGGGSSVTLTKSTVGLGNVDNYSFSTIKTNIFLDNTFTTVETNASTAVGYFSSGLIKSTALPFHLRIYNVNLGNSNLNISAPSYYGNGFVRDTRTLETSRTITIPYPSNCTGCKILFYRGTNIAIKSSNTIRCPDTSSNYFVSSSSEINAVLFAPDSQSKPLEIYSNGSQWFVTS